MISGSCVPEFYGIRITEKWPGSSLPILRLAEQARRTLARKYKKMRSNIG
jgi:hypothetical protein